MFSASMALARFLVRASRRREAWLLAWWSDWSFAEEGVARLICWKKWERANVCSVS